MDAEEDEVRVHFVNLDLNTQETELFTFSSYEDNTVVYIGHPGRDMKMFEVSKEQLEELHNAVGEALKARKEVLDDQQAHFTNGEIKEHLEK